MQIEPCTAGREDLGVDVNVSLPGAPVHAGEAATRSAPLWRCDLDLAVRGPERLALTGPNGCGKTTLLRCLVGDQDPSRGQVRRGVDGIGYLPQRLDVLDSSRSVLENLRRVTASSDENTLRASLARFGFRAADVHRRAGTLSGGERFRAVLAVLLAADPPPRLLVLDEPTNNLDLDSCEQLRSALSGYRGAIIVASHDLHFLDSVGVTRWLALDRERGLEDIDHP